MHYAWIEAGLDPSADADDASEDDIDMYDSTRLPLAAVSLWMMRRAMRTMHAEACLLQAEYLRCLSVRLRRLLILVVLVDVDCRTVLWALEVLVALVSCVLLCCS